MTVDSLLAAIRTRLAARIDPVYREGATRFFQHEVRLHGVRQKDLLPIEQFVYREIKAWPASQRNLLCDALWKAGTLEEGTMVCHVYRRFHRQCGPCEFQLFERWIDRYVHNWAHCDGVSAWLLAASLANEPSLLPEVLPWTASPNRWKRRASAVSLLQEGKAGRNTEFLLEVASRLAADGDDMVQKGLGWLLKEAYVRRPAEVVAFLTARPEIPRLVLRYAAEKMTAPHRALVLGK